jgi:hypothetical protein
MVPPRIEHPLSSHPPFHGGNVIGHAQDGDRRASTAATGRRIVPSIPESLLGRARGVLAEPMSFRMDEPTRWPEALGSQAMGWREQETARIRNQPCRNLVSSRGRRTRVRGTSCRCGGGFAKQVAGNVENGESPTLLRERLEIRLDEKSRWSRRRIKSRHEWAHHQSQPRGVVHSLLE